MAYSSKINIRLGEVPKTTDPSVFPDMVDIYNAIHILNQYMDSIREHLESTAGEPRFWTVTVTATQDLQQSQIVTVFNTWLRVDGVGLREIKGTYPGYGIGGMRSRGIIVPDEEYGWTNSNSTTEIYNKWEETNAANELTGPTSGIFAGFVMADAKAGEEVEIGFGYQVLNITGVKLGDNLMVQRAFTEVYTGNEGIGFGGFPKRYKQNNDGSIYVYKPPPRGYVSPTFHFIGVGIGEDKALVKIEGPWSNPDNFSSYVRR